MWTCKQLGQVDNKYIRRLFIKEFNKCLRTLVIFHHYSFRDKRFPYLKKRWSAMVRIRNSWRWCGPASSWGRTDLTIGGVRGVQLTMLTSMLASCGTQMGGKTKKNPIGWQKRRKTSTKSLSGAEKSGKVNCCISCWFSKPVPMTQSDCFPGDSNMTPGTKIPSSDLIVTSWQK